MSEENEEEEEEIEELNQIRFTSYMNLYTDKNQKKILNEYEFS